MQGLHVSIGVGVAMCALQFAYKYARIQLTSVSVVLPRSHALAPQHSQQVLALFKGNMVALSLSGALQLHACMQQFMTVSQMHMSVVCTPSLDGTVLSEEHDKRLAISWLLSSSAGLRHALCCSKK